MKCLRVDPCLCHIVEVQVPYKGPPLEQLQMELRSYMRKLTAIHKAIYLQERKKRAL